MLITAAAQKWGVDKAQCRAEKNSVINTASNARFSYGSLADAGFVHAILKIGAGRSDAAKNATKAGLFDIMKQHFAALYEKQPLALSLEFVEFSESGTLKHNNLHARLRNT